MIIDNTEPISKAPADPAFQKLFNDLQGNIVKSHARPHVQLLFIEFTGSVNGVKQFLATSIADLVTTFEMQLNDTKTFKMQRNFQDPGFFSFSLSAKGYAFLDIPITDKDASFQQGMSAGSVTNDPSKENWELPYQENIHGLITLAHSSRKQLGLMVTAVKTKVAGIARIVAEESGDALLGEKEHFGFADGRSQPRFMTEDMAPEGPTINWNPFASLNLVLKKDGLGKAFIDGITGQGDIPSDPDNASHSYGSYLVFRKLKQDVAGWNAQVAAHAGTMGIGPELFGAYAVGRSNDGTPTVLSSTPSGSTTIDNDFTYSADPNALKCPFHAHIRKANPRGETAKFNVPLEDEKKKRIARRGIPYGTPESENKGLLFMCYQSSIVDQFEFMQNSWIDNPNFLNPAVGNDSTIGQGTAAAKDWPSVYGQPAKVSLTFNHFVELRGGEYFFTPPVSFLRSL